MYSIKGGDSISASDSFQPIQMQDCCEIYGTLHSVKAFDNETVIAQIGQRDVILPANLELPEGQIFVLYLDGKYYVRRG